MPTRMSKRGIVRVTKMEKVVIMSMIRAPIITFIALFFELKVQATYFALAKKTV